MYNDNHQKTEAIYIWLKIFTRTGIHGTVEQIEPKDYPTEIPDYYTCFKCHVNYHGDLYVGIWEDGNKVIGFQPERKRGKKFFRDGFAEGDLPKTFNHLMWLGLWGW